MLLDRRLRFASPLHPRRRRFVALPFLFACLALHAAPTITTQPVDVTTTSGLPATLTVAASGAGPLSFQWHRSGFPIPGATAATYTIASSRRTDAGFYSVNLTDSSRESVTSRAIRLAVAPHTRATTVAPDPAWNLELEFDAPNAGIEASLALPDGGFLVAGSFTAIAGARRSHVARLNHDGALNPGFVPAESDGEIAALAVQPDGKILIGGGFARVGRYTRPRLARLNPDGSVDATFATSITTNDAPVTRIVVAPDGRILVVGGTSNGVMRLRSDGSPDVTFLAVPNSLVTTLALQPDGKILLAGHFTTINGTPRAHLARVDSGGAVDPSFDPRTNLTIGRALALQPDGRIVVGGYALLPDLTATPSLIRVTATGGPDASFNSGLNRTNSDGRINALALDSSQRILVGGSFHRFAGLARIGFVRLSPAGIVDASMPGNVGLVSTLALAPRDAGGIPEAILLGGGLASNAGSLQRSGIARLTPAGALDPAYNFTFRRATPANALAALVDGKFLVAGAFTYVRGVRVPTGLIRVNADGTLDRTFNAGGRGIGAFPGSADGATIFALSPLPDGRIVIAGTFGTYNSVPRINLAVLRADGSLDAAFVPAGGANGSIYSIAVLPDGRFAIAGAFDRVNGTARRAVAVLRLDGSVDPSFAPPGASFNSHVYALAVQPDGGILVGGDFTSFAGTPVGRVARLLPTGALDPAFNQALGAGFDRLVNCLALHPDGRIAVGGSFNRLGSRRMNGLARLAPDGTPDASYGPVDFWGVTALAALEDGSVLARSLSAASVPARAFFSRFTPQGANDPDFVAVGFSRPLPSFVPTVLVLDDGRILGGGNSTDQGIFMTLPIGPPAVTAPPTEQFVARGGSATFSATTVAGFLPLAYQWFVAGRPIAGATNATLTVTDARRSDSGAYTVQVTSDAGSVTATVGTLTGRLSGPRLANVATRANHENSDRALIAGFVITGTEPKEVLLRAVGPALAPFGVTNALADPVLELSLGQNRLNTINDWGPFPSESSPHPIEAAAARVGAFPLVRGSRDAAIVLTLPPGAYSAAVRGNGTAPSGVALVEVYDAGDPLDDSAIVNLSTRGHVGTGASLLIAGLVIDGPGTRQVLIRAAGPALAPFGVGGTLGDPVVQVFREGVLVATNDDWSRDPIEAAATALATQQTAAFAFPPGSRDAALVRRLEPGAYTVQVGGAGGTTGVALIEIYSVP